MLEVAGRPLIEHVVERLRAAGHTRLVVNLAYRGEQIRRHLGSGARFGVDIAYSEEPDGALETGGGIAAALPLLGPEPFLAVNADLWTDYDFRQVAPPRGLAHLVLVPNPDHNPKGDFAIDGGMIVSSGGEMATFSGIGIYAPALFGNCRETRFPLAPLLRRAVRRGLVSGTLYSGQWADVGTPARLAHVRAHVALQHHG